MQDEGKLFVFIAEICLNLDIRKYLTITLPGMRRIYNILGRAMSFSIIVDQKFGVGAMIVQGRLHPDFVKMMAKYTYLKTIDIFL